MTEEIIRYQELFRIVKILLLAEVITISKLRNTYNYITHANFNRNYSKINIKLNSSYSFRDQN